MIVRGDMPELTLQDIADTPNRHAPGVYLAWRERPGSVPAYDLIQFGKTPDGAVLEASLQNLCTLPDDRRPSRFEAKSYVSTLEVPELLKEYRWKALALRLRNAQALVRRIEGTVEGRKAIDDLVTERLDTGESLSVDEVRNVADAIESNRNWEGKYRELLKSEVREIKELLEKLK